jgi:hypothetical protein
MLDRSCWTAKLARSAMVARKGRTASTSGTETAQMVATASSSVGLQVPARADTNSTSSTPSSSKPWSVRKTTFLILMLRKGGHPEQGVLQPVLRGRREDRRPRAAPWQRGAVPKHYPHPAQPGGPGARPRLGGLGVAPRYNNEKTPVRAFCGQGFPIFEWSLPVVIPTVQNF